MILQEGEQWEEVSQLLAPLSWEQFAGKEIRVDPNDWHRTPPSCSLISHNLWRTPRPQPNQARMQPTKHPAMTTRGGDAMCPSVVRRVPDRLGAGSICQVNCEQFMECEPSCVVNTGVTNRLTTSFMLKYHDGRQWGLHTVTAYNAGDWVGEYVGEMLSRDEGERRKRSKIATSPSYLLQVGPRYLDAEEFGNAVRFVTTCV